MIRKEQIEQHAKSYTLTVFGELDDFSDVTDAYIESAKWADKHPNKDLKRLIRKAESYDKLVNKGFVNIERVCEWLSDNTGKYIIVTGGGYWFNDIEFIKDLKKAMAMEE
jgi:hypothetical protein